MPAATIRWRATWRAPWARARRAIGQGLAQVQTGVGTFIAYSTQPGNVALDGQGRNSPFTAALTKGLREPGRNLTSVMIDVRKDVLAVTGGKQVPWDHSALTGDFYFHLAAAPGTLPKPDGDATQRRLRELEEELKKKSDPQQTANIVALAQARERLRQSEEANKQDQKKIFDIQYSIFAQSGPGLGCRYGDADRRHPDADGASRSGDENAARADRQARGGPRTGATSGRRAGEVARIVGAANATLS